MHPASRNPSPYCSCQAGVQEKWADSSLYEAPAQCISHHSSTAVGWSLGPVISSTISNNRSQYSSEINADFFLKTQPVAAAMSEFNLEGGLRLWSDGDMIHLNYSALTRPHHRPNFYFTHSHSLKYYHSPLNLRWEWLNWTKLCFWWLFELDMGYLMSDLKGDLLSCSYCWN